MSSCSFVVGLSASQPENQLESSNSASLSRQGSNTSLPKDEQPYDDKLLSPVFGRYKRPIEIRLTIE